jgi:hypothetical protein
LHLAAPFHKPLKTFSTAILTIGDMTLLILVVERLFLGCRVCLCYGVFYVSFYLCITLVKLADFFYYYRFGVGEQCMLIHTCYCVGAWFTFCLMCLVV